MDDDDDDYHGTTGEGSDLIAKRKDGCGCTNPGWGYPKFTTVVSSLLSRLLHYKVFYKEPVSLMPRVVSLTSCPPRAYQQSRHVKQF